MWRALPPWPLVALAVLLAALPAASAQVPSAPPCATLEASHVAFPELEPGASATYAQTVENGGRSEVVVTVRALAEGSAWTVEPQEQQTTIAPGESGTAQFTITAPADRDAGDSRLRVTAEGFCSLNGNPGPFPTSTAVDGADLRLAPVKGVQIPGLPEVSPTLLLGGLGVLAILGGGFLLARNRTEGFTLACAEPHKRVRAGRGTSFALDVHNTGSSPDTAVLQVEPVDDGWHAFMAVPEVQLAAKEARTIWLMVRAPEDASPGDGAQIRVAVRSKTHPQQVRSVEVRAEVGDAEAPSGE